MQRICPCKAMYASLAIAIALVLALATVLATASSREAFELGSSNVTKKTDSCRGHWTGGRCVFDGDECTREGEDRVSRWRGSDCVVTEECRKGFWDGEQCVIEGGACEVTSDPTADPKRMRAWTRTDDWEDLSCEALPACKGAWFSRATGSCLVEGEGCEVSGQAGEVAAVVEPTLCCWPIG